MADQTPEVIETLRQLTLQIMLISAGVFGIVGGFLSSSDKKFCRKVPLGFALILFAISALLGYFLHGVIISQLNTKTFDPFSNMLVFLGVSQIFSFFIGGVLFTWFVIANIDAN
jgi:hypothetical protein